MLTVHAELLVGDAKSIYESGFRGLCFYTISHTQDELILKRTNKSINMIYLATLEMVQIAFHILAYCIGANKLTTSI